MRGDRILLCDDLQGKRHTNGENTAIEDGRQGVMDGRKADGLKNQRQAQLVSTN